MASPSSFIAIVLILSCGLLGGYASMGLAFQHGFFEAIGDCLRVAHGTASPSTECVLIRAHEYHRSRYTGITALDNAFCLLFEFFAMGFAGPSDLGKVDYGGLMSSSYMATLFCGAWFLMAMEGLRKRNSGTILSYTGLFGIVFQIATIAITAPIYLTLQILSLPPVQDYETVAVDSIDLSTLPWATTISYILPSLGLALPALNILSVRGNYHAIALWQPFPLYQSVLHPLLRSLFGRSSQSSKRRESPEQVEKSLGKAYRFVLSVCMGVHLVVVGTLVANHFQNFIPGLTFAEALGPTSLTNPPILAMAQTPVPAAVSRDIVGAFLRWDIYSTSASFILWASYLAYSTEKGPGFFGILEKILFWTVAGGPIAAAAMLLWERDLAVLKKVRASQASTKKK